METKTSHDNILTEAPLNEDKEYNRIKAKYQDLTSKRSQKIFWLYATVTFLANTGIALWFAFYIYYELSLSIVLGTLLISLSITIFILAFFHSFLKIKKAFFNAEYPNMKLNIFKRIWKKIFLRTRSK